MSERLASNPSTAGDTVPAYLLRATRAVLAERERELLELKGPCSTALCRLHYAHAGPCDLPTAAAHPPPAPTDDCLPSDGRGA